MDNWQDAMKVLNEHKVVVNNNIKISLLTGTDSVHGNQHVLGEIIFPHNIGLGAANNEEYFEYMGYHTALSTKESGYNYIFSPCVAIAHNP